MRVHFIGYDADDLPAYLFTYGEPGLDAYLPPHGHRDNLNEGFAFSVFHPGTSVQQMPFQV